jgi:hypothetical protein
MNDKIIYDISMFFDAFITPKSRNCRIYIVNISEDDGKVLGTGKRYILDKNKPAHSYLFDEYKKFIGCINITGPRPKRDEDIIEYNKQSDSRIDKYRKDIVDIVNRKNLFDPPNNYFWDGIRYSWWIRHNSA